jgi:hypothetical protein
MNSTLRPRSIQGDRITTQVVDTETLIYDECHHKAWCLNHISASVWRLCDGEHTVAAIAGQAARELDAPVPEDVVLLTLAELREKELLEPDSAELLPQGVTRRQMIARVGLTAAALLPAIATLTAPVAFAQGPGGSTATGDAVDPS